MHTQAPRTTLTGPGGVTLQVPSLAPGGDAGDGTLQALGVGGGVRERRRPSNPSRTPGTHREAPGRVHLDHAAQQALAVGRDKVRHMEHAPLHLLQQLPQVVVVEGQSPLPAGDWGHLGRGAQGQRRGAGEGASPPAGRTGSRRSSTRLPCGRHTSPPAGDSGVGGVNGRAPQKWWGPGTGCRGESARARGLQGSGGKAPGTGGDKGGGGGYLPGSPRGRRSGAIWRQKQQSGAGFGTCCLPWPPHPACTRGCPPGPQQGICPRHAPPAGPRAHQEAQGALVPPLTTQSLLCASGGDRDTGACGLRHARGCLPAALVQGQ